MTSYNLLNLSRRVVISLLALNADGSTYMDLSQYLVKADLTFSDQLESHKASFTLANNQAYFDIYATNGGSQVFTLGRIIKYEKGFFDPTTGETTLYPAFYGKVSADDWDYERGKGETITVTIFDLMYSLLTQTVTTPAFYNQDPNLIAATLIQRYAGLTNTNFAALDESLPVTQFPSFTVADALKDLYDPWLYFVWFNYEGALTTRPRVGSAASGAPGLVGYPDATEPPADDLVAFTFPDATLLDIHTLGQRDFTFDNQVRVLGQALTETLTYGPVQLLTNVGDSANASFLDEHDNKSYNLALSQPTYNQNVLTARGVYVRVFDLSFFNFGGNGYKTLCSDPLAVDLNGVAVPLGPNEDPGWIAHNGAFPSIKSIHADGRQDGGIVLKVNQNPGTSSWLTVPLVLYANGNGHGFFYAIEVYGQPIITSNATLTKILDYNIVTLTQAVMSDIFGDHRTYQTLDPSDLTGLTTIQPLAMGTPLEIYVNPTSLPSTTLTAAVIAGATTLDLSSIAGFTLPPTPVAGGISGMNTVIIRDGANTEYGIIKSISGSSIALSQPLQYNHAGGVTVAGATAVLTADGLNVSPYVKADWEQGRIVFNDMTYKDYLEDDSASHPYSSGGNATSFLPPSGTYDLTHIVNPCLPVVYNTQRESSSPTDGTGFTYSIAGLTIGYGYQLRLHYADHLVTGAGQRLFSVLFNGVEVETSFDIWAEAGGSFYAYVKTYDGIVTDNTGTLTIQFINGGSYGGLLSPLINAIELIDPQGTGGALPVINCGGPAITPTPPVVKINSAYSPNQRQFGIRNMEINNPLLSTIDQCTDTGTWYLNQSAWQRNPHAIETASIPTVEPGQIVKHFNPRIGRFGSDQWMYVQLIDRTTSRSSRNELADQDKYTGFLLYTQPRTS